MIAARTVAIHEAIMEGKAAAILDRPADTDLFYGFDNMFKDFTEQVRNSPDSRTGLANHFHDLLVTTAEAVGAQRVWNIHGGAMFPNKEKPASDDIEKILDAISEKIGIDVDFPNPFPDEFGLKTSRGIASDRSIQAIYQAWRIKQLSHQYGSRVLEIGAGMGRIAYYAHKLGVRDYTIIDLPMTNVSQANFPGRVLSPKHIRLYGETPVAGTIRIVPITEINNFGDFDVIANTDSLTEMGHETALAYANYFVERAAVLWSVNHEANEDTVSNLEPLRHRLVGRFPYWLRSGYVEEIFLGRSQEAYLANPKLDLLTRRIEAMENSTSWRITAPMRWIKSRLSGG